METVVKVRREEPLQRFRQIFGGRTVLVTGHTGFKGSWLCEWLLLLGARVVGFSQPPCTEPALFDQFGLASRLDHRLGDICDQSAVALAVQETRPDFIFHLAAQALVRLSYREPVKTYAVNILGTANLLEAVRARNAPCVVVGVTTDKCYENREWLHAYREEDPLGGHDPYSSSKAAAELVIAAYRRSFFHDGVVKLASARAGNVIGGGDWAAERIVPDCIRALVRGETLSVRNPGATRPWQHVIEPLGGYLALAAGLAKGPTPEKLSSAFNFGPGLGSNRTVGELVTELFKHRLGVWRDDSDPDAPHEAQLLNLAVDKAFHLLGWQPLWSFERTVAETARGYQHGSGRHAVDFARSQILAYASEAAAFQKWAR